MAATQFEIDNALMAGTAYRSTRSSTNRFPLPAGWSEVPLSHVNLPSGFEAISFRRGTQIVISYAGTGPGLLPGSPGFVDWITNSGLGTGFGSDQLWEAALYYLEVKVANPGATISFTGHSLGGGLAALMAVFFDEQAVTFDQAPFAASLNAIVRNGIEIFLNASGYSDTQLTALVPEFMNYSEGTRTANVTGYYVQGEALQYIPLAQTIGTQVPLTQHSVDLGLSGPIDLHSQTLLTAFLLNDGFRALTLELPNLLQAMFDEGLYAESTSPGPDAQRNFLDNLVRHQIGVAAIPADAMLDRFVVDLERFTPDTWGTASGTGMSQALTVYAMEYHYLKTTGATQAFTLADYGLHFKYSDIGASGYKSLPKLADAVNAFLTPEEKALLGGRLVKQDAWHIQSGTGGMIVHGGADNDVAFGGTNSDGLWGGGGIDILIGGANNDVLVGEAGNDTLIGGIGNDTYVINPGDGTDTVLDSDGSGSIIFNGLPLTGGALVVGTTNVWKNPTQGITYTLKGSGASQVLLISKDGSADGIRVQGWQPGQLGLDLTGAIAPPAIGVITGADGYSDGLTGSGGDDRILGLSGNDALDGSAGDDIIEGGLGDDLLAGGSGSDLIYGGAGRDMILSATGLNAPPRDANHDNVYEDWAPPAGAGAVWTQGRTWGIYASAADVYVVDGGGSLAQDSAGDIVFAGDDDDRVVGGLGDDYIDGGLGNDTLTGHGGNDVIDGSDGNDILNGDGILKPGFYQTLAETQNGNDVLDGGAGNDQLIGGGADDGLFGGIGNDKLWGDDATEADLGGQYHGSDYLDGGDGDDQLIGGGKDDYLIGGTGADLLRGDVDDEADLAGQYHGDDSLDGGDGNDQLVGGGGNDILVGGAGADVMFGDARNGTTLTAQYQGDDILYGDAGDDQLVGGGGNDSLYGGADNDQLQGEAGSDILDGGTGNDYLDGGTGADIMAGGAGDDAYIVDDIHDVVIEAANEGTDTVNSSVSIVLPDNVEWLNLTGAWNIDATGNAEANSITGNAGANRLEGGAGNDQLIGGAGADTLVGGTGDDYYELDDAGDAITELAGEGNDFVRSTVSRTLENHVEGLALDGTANLDATGNALDNSLYGNQGANTLAGGAGNDFLMGGAGNDTYVFNRGDGQDSIDDLDGLGATNTLRFGTGIADTDVVGYRVGDDMVLKLKGSSEQVAVIGYYGADTVDGGVVSNRRIDRVEFGNGVVWDQAMIQTAVDRAANNQVPVLNAPVPALQAHAGDVFSYVVPADAIVDPDAGDSIVYSVSMPDGSPVPAWLMFDVASRTLSGTPEVPDIGSLQFVLWGTDDYGMAIGQYVTLGVSMPNHAPALSVPLPDQAVSLGSAFNFTVAPGAFTDPDAGDVLAYSAVLTNGNALPAWLHFDAATRTFSGTPTGQGTFSVRVTAKDIGNLAVSDAFDIVVSAPNMVLNGTSGPDYLTGNSGNDTFDGGPGNDTLQGGLGNDVYLFGAGDGRDTIVETGGSTDVLRFKPGIQPRDINLLRWSEWGYSDVEDSLRLIRVNADGSSTQDHVQIKNYFVSSDSSSRVDLFEFSDGTVWTYTDIKSRLLRPSTNNADNLEGFADADIVNGLSGNDSINGKAGDDVLLGGDGDDDLQGGLGNDTLLGGTGNDRLLGYGVWLNDSAAARDDVGDDILHGGAGNDRMFGGRGNDTYLFGRGDGYDLVGDSPNVSGPSLDTLRLGAGILPENVTLYRFGTRDLVIVIDGSNQQIHLSDYYFVDQNGVSDWSIERIEFDDGAGAVWTATDVATRVVSGAPNNMVGTTGNDTFVVDHVHDIISEASNAGIDTVFTTQTYTLPENIENLTLTGFLNINGTGNALDNILRGNNGDNVLTGNGGNDVAYGGPGNDTYRGVMPIELPGEGVDTYLGRHFSVLPDNIEIWNLNDGSGFRPNSYYTVHGNALDNTLISDGFGFLAYTLPSGVTVGDILDGGIGADTVIIQGSDKPIVYVDNPGDLVIGAAYEIRSTTNYVLKAKGRLVLLGNNPISGTGSAQDDVLIGNNAINTLSGLDGNDTIYAGNGDGAFGGAGDDILLGQNATGQWSYLYGEAGNDTLTGGAGSGAFFGGAGNDIITGGAGDNYIWGDDFGTGAGGDDVIHGGNGYDLVFAGGGNDVVFGNGGNDQINGGHGNDTLRGGDGNDTLEAGAGTSWEYLYGQAGDDSLIGGTGNNVMYGGLGADTITGGDKFDFIWGDEINETLGGGDDTINAGAGDDYVFGGVGNDRLHGEAGHDYLVGGSGNDIYLFGRGGGVDSVSETDATAGNTDVAQFLSGIAADQIWFEQSGNDLEVSIIGTADRLVIQSWYSGSANHVEQFKTTDDAKTLLDSNVQNLVNAMASFAPPTAGQTTLSQSYQDVLAGVIAANWQ